MRSISAIRADGATPYELRRQQIVRLEPGLTASSVEASLVLGDAEWLAVNAEALRILDENVRERIRDVVQGPDGALYLLTDDSDGRVLKLVRKAG